MKTNNYHPWVPTQSVGTRVEFKQKPNRIGETHFVATELVRSTLLQGFEMYHAVEPGLGRSIFMMFMLAEVHPFVDGNGRIARIMMKAELILGRKGWGRKVHGKQGKSKN